MGLMYFIVRFFTKSGLKRNVKQYELEEYLDILINKTNGVCYLSIFLTKKQQIIMFSSVLHQNVRNILLHLPIDRKKIQNLTLLKESMKKNEITSSIRESHKGKNRKRIFLMVHDTQNVELLTDVLVKAIRDVYHVNPEDLIDISITRDMNWVATSIDIDDKEIQ